MATQARDTSGFAPASHQSQALSLGTLGVSLLLWPIAVWGFESPVRFAAGWAAAGAGVWLLVKAQRRWRMHGMETTLRAPDEVGVDLTPGGLEEVRAQLSPEVLANAQYQRLRKVVEDPGPDTSGRSRQGWGAIKKARIEDDILVAYTIQTSHGLLTNKKIKTDKAGQLADLLDRNDGTRWEIKAIPGDDIITGQLIRDQLPRAIAPDILTSPATVEEAIANYPKMRWRFGVDAQGNEVSSLMCKQAHVALVAETGGGKSVMAACLLEMMRPVAACWVFDGKGSDYPPNLIEHGNVVWISKSPEEHIVGIRWLMDEMEERFFETNKRRGEGRAGEAFDYPPIFVLLDELGSMRSQIDQLDPKGGLEKFDYFVNQLLRKGRQCRIHLCVCSQTVRVADIPGIWQENITQMIFFGKVSGRSALSDKIPEQIRPDILEMTRRISDDQKGRGVFIVRDDVGVKPVLFQGYWAYTPGISTLEMANGHPEVQQRWRSAIEALPKMAKFYDRVGIEVDGPEWREATVAEIADTPTVIVADENGPVPGMEIYDPLAAEFVGATTPGAGRKRARGRGSVGARKSSRTKS